VVVVSSEEAVVDVYEKEKVEAGVGVVEEVEGYNIATEYAQSLGTHFDTFDCNQN
jgi:hypothetical protein